MHKQLLTFESRAEKSNIALLFTHGHKITYLSDIKASNNLPASDIKTASEHALHSQKEVT